MQRLKVLALLFFFSTVAHASAPNDLEHFFSGVHTYTARFQQVVLDDKLNITQESSGTLWIERPGKFRWDYDAPFKQQIVGDGARIWVYDVELQQATVRPMSAALGNTLTPTPASPLIAPRSTISPGSARRSFIAATRL